MANANALSLCPRCETETEPLKKICSVCGYRIHVDDNPYFDIPDYVTFQLDDIFKEADLSEKSTDQRKIAAKKAQIQRELDKFWEDCKDEVRVACMQDAIKCMRTALNSRASVDTMRQITAAGKQMGDLAKTIEEYFKNGGQYNGAKIPEATASALGQQDEDEIGGAEPLLR